MSFGLDPIVQMNVHCFPMLMAFSHELPTYKSQFELYDSLLGRASDYLRSRDGALVCIDVGANIGDSVIACKPQSMDKFFAIEPSKHYLKFLSRNTAKLNTTISKTIVGEVSRRGKFTIVEDSGTATLVEVDNALGYEEMLTLDDLIKADGSRFSAPNLLKIDTDGYDLKIISGAQSLLRENNMFLLFECDWFRRTSYLADLELALSQLANSGFTQILVYDNVGYLIGMFEIADARSMRDLVMYQMQRNGYYFDVLAIKGQSALDFYSKEQEFFMSRAVS